MNTPQPFDVLLLILATVLSAGPLVGCRGVTDETKPSEKNTQALTADENSSPALSGEQIRGSTHPIIPTENNCNSDQDSSQFMRIRTTKEGETIGVTESDTLGFAMKDVFSAPGEWTFIDRPSTREIVFEGAEDPIERDVLMYYCVDGLHEYPNCGKPESIGNPDEYEYRKSIQIYFLYKIDRCNSRFYVSHYDNTTLNSEYAKFFLAYHGFPASDTNVVRMRRMEF